jgi:hypothetical protein
MIQNLKTEPKIERKVYEKALSRMEKMGSNAINHPHLLEKREVIKSSLLRYYESTEEYEKCQYITNFFANLEKEILKGILISQILTSTKESKTEE